MRGSDGSVAPGVRPEPPSSPALHRSRRTGRSALPARRPSPRRWRRGRYRTRQRSPTARCTRTERRGPTLVVDLGARVRGWDHRQAGGDPLLVARGLQSTLSSCSPPFRTLGRVNDEVEAAVRRPASRRVAELPREQIDSGARHREEHRCSVVMSASADAEDRHSADIPTARRHSRHVTDIGTGVGTGGPR